MSHPYRSGSRAAAPPSTRVLVKEQERPPLRVIRVREFSDGTTALRFRRKRSIELLGFCWFWGCFAVAMTVVEIRDPNVGFWSALCILLTGLMGFVVGIDHIVSGERIVMTPAGLVRRRGAFVRPDVAPLDEVSAVVVTGNEPHMRVDVQLGRRRLQILEGLGYSQAHLLWCVQRLRRGLDVARAARTG
jgi:hypothetical protein